MVISAYTSANQPFTNTGINPAFFGAKTQTSASSSTTQQVTITPPAIQQIVQPPAYTTQVQVQPPSIQQVVAGQAVTVDFPAFTQSITVTPPAQTVTVQPPSKTVTVSTAGSPVVSVSDSYESVGVVDGQPQKLVALVRPNVVAGAHHYALNPGDKISFYGTNGLVRATVAGVAKTFSDLELYYLTAPVVGITPAPIPTGLQPFNFMGSQIVTFGLVGNRQQQPYIWTPAAMSGVILFVITQFDGSWDAYGNSSAGYLEFGDSGSPTFVTMNGTIYYFGSMHKISGVFEINPAVPYAAQINSL